MRRKEGLDGSPLYLEAKNLYGELSAAFGSVFLASPPLLDFGIIQAEAVGHHGNTA